MVDAGESCDDGNETDGDSCPDSAVGQCRIRMCAGILALNPNAESGYYAIYPDGDDQAQVNAYCDMVTDGGGWTAVINPFDYQELYLNQFPAQINTIVNYGSYTSPATGVNWGGFVEDSAWDLSPYRVELNISYDEVLITYSGFYDDPEFGLGRLDISNQAGDGNIISFIDPQTGGSGGHSLYVDSTNIFFQSTTDVVDRTDSISIPNSTLLTISMNSYTDRFPYTRRYIRALWIR